MRIASIDLGTNTCLLLILEFNKQNNYKIIYEDISYPRIGHKVDKNKLINKNSFIKAADSILNYKSICIRYKVDVIKVTGTSALRDAKNNIQFLSFIKKQTGLQINILSGHDEARLTSLGLSYKSKINDFAIIDIGGGSTEIILTLNNKIKYSKSFDIGAVRLNERFLSNTPPTINEIKEFRDFVKSQLKFVKSKIFKNSCLVGVAGTITTLKSYELKLKSFSQNKIEGKYISLKKIKSIFSYLSKLNKDEINKITQISERRKDIILSGILILIEFMTYFQWKKVKISTKGLRYGVAIEEFLKLNS